MAMDSADTSTHPKSLSDGEVEKTAKPKKIIRRSRSVAITQSEVAALLLTRNQFLSQLTSPNPLKRVKVLTILQTIDGEMVYKPIVTQSSVKPGRLPRTKSYRHLSNATLDAIHYTKKMLISVPDGK